MIKRFAFQICLLLSVCLLAVWGMIRESVQTQNTIKTTPSVIIDAGHGGLTNTTH